MDGFGRSSTKVWGLCGSQEGLQSHWNVNSIATSLIYYLLYTQSEDGIPVRSKIPDALDLFKIMIYFLPAIKPPPWGEFALNFLPRYVNLAKGVLEKIPQMVSGL